MAKIEITVFRKAGGVLSKRISLTRSGKIKSDGGECRMSRGRARRVMLADLDALAELIENMPSNEALTLGRLRPGLPNRVNVVRKHELGDNAPADTIARSNDYLHFAPGQPAPLLLDHDRKGVPEDVRTKLREVKGVWNGITSAIPALGKAARVTRRSTSSGLYHHRTGHRFPGSRNQHIYLEVQDGSDIERALKTLHERLWLEGYGFYVVGAIGQLLDRSLIDAAVYGPERLVFEGESVVILPLKQERRAPKVYKGAAIDTRQTIPDLTTDEAERVTQIKAAQAQRLKPQCLAARKAWAVKFAARKCRATIKVRTERQSG
jgi:hypothetical protein